MPAKTTAVNDAAGNVDFGTITFTTDFLQDAITTDNGVRTKEFEYKVTEAGNAAGVTNDVRFLLFGRLCSTAGVHFQTACLEAESHWDKKDCFH